MSSRDPHSDTLIMYEAYQAGESLAQIGRRYGISKNAVFRRLERVAVRKGEKSPNQINHESPAAVARATQRLHEAVERYLDSIRGAA